MKTTAIYNALSQDMQKTPPQANANYVPQLVSHVDNLLTNVFIVNQDTS